MTNEFDNRYIAPPLDPDAEERVARLKALGVGDLPDSEFDEYARRLSERTGAPFAFVNFIDQHRQYAAGLRNRLDGSDDETPDHASRSWDRDLGYCVYVVVRKHALVLEDLRDFPRFHSNIAVEAMGFQSYLGAPLMDSTGIALGTIGVTDTQPRRWGRAGLKLVKSMAAELMDRIRERAKDELDVRL